MFQTDPQESDANPTEHSRPDRSKRQVWRSRWVEAVLLGLAVNVIWAFLQYARRWLPDSWPLAGHVRWLPPGKTLWDVLRAEAYLLVTFEVLSCISYLACVLIIRREEGDDWHSIARETLPVLLIFLFLLPIIFFCLFILPVTVTNLLHGRPLLLLPWDNLLNSL
jgi:hypothetical protein